MRRHLKVRVEYVPCSTRLDEPHVRLTVIEQTHLCRSFSRGSRGNVGQNPEFNTDVFGWGNVRLRAKETAGFEYTGSRDYGIEVAIGKDPYVGSVNIPIEYWPEVKEAIEAYNKIGDLENEKAH